MIGSVWFRIWGYFSKSTGFEGGICKEVFCLHYILYASLKVSDILSDIA